MKYNGLLSVFVLYYCNHNCGIMASLLASSAVDRGFEPCSGQAKDYEVGMCCFSAKRTA